jgi:flagellar hook-basal body complex protein FliE
MIQMQKASISFQMMMEVRNKLVDAYNEIIKMRG